MFFKHLKKLSVILLAVAAMVSISGCNTSKSENYGDNKEDNSIKEEISETVSVEYYEVSCNVVEKGDERQKIQNADIEMINTDTDDVYTTHTDSEGKFRLEIPEGQYTLKISAENYREYVWSDEDEINESVITVNSDGGCNIGNYIRLTKTDENIFYDFLRKELIPEYGLVTLEPFEVGMKEEHGLKEYVYGIVSADIDDYNGDGVKEMIVLTLEQGEDEQYFCDAKLTLFEINDMNVSICNTVTLNRCYLERNDIYYDNFLTLKKCGDKLLFTANVSYYSGEGYDSDIGVVSIENNELVFDKIRYTHNMGSEEIYNNKDKIFDVTYDLSSDDLKKIIQQFVEDAQGYIEEKLSEKNIPFESIDFSGVGDENKHEEFKVNLTDATDIAVYSSEFKSSNDKATVTPDDYTTIRDYITNFEKTDGIKSKGICGKNISWGLYEDGTLVLNGTGEMTDYGSENVPWSLYCEDIKKINISDGITSIGDNAFYLCDEFSEIDIPDSVESLGEHSFAAAESLKSIVIPDSVTFIGRDAFNDCDGLESVVIPDSVTDIGMYAFYKCRSLKNIEMSDSVIIINSGIFGFCNELQSIDIPKGVGSIGIDAFMCCNSLSDVYYAGTEEEWNNIIIEPSTRTNSLDEAEIHFGN